MLCYGSKIWGFYEDKEVERTVLQYFKYILGLPGNATNIAVRGEVGQFLIHLYWIENIIKYWCRVSKTDSPILCPKSDNGSATNEARQQKVLVGKNQNNL